MTQRDLSGTPCQQVSTSCRLKIKQPLSIISADLLRLTVLLNASIARCVLHLFPVQASQVNCEDF